MVSPRADGNLQYILFYRVYWIEYALSKMDSLSLAWRFPLGFQAVFLIIILCLAPFYPESPRHRAKIGDMDGARAILTQCRAKPDPALIETEMGEIVEALRLEAAASSQSYLSMIFTKDRLHTRRRIMLGAGVQIMQKFTGIDFISVYAPTMFTLSGFTGDLPALLAGFNWFGYVTALALSIWLSDKVGRRNMMLTGCLAMGLVLIVGGVLSHEVTSGDPSKKHAYGIGVATILYLYTFIYGGTWLTTW
jgi:MFS family permease